MRTRYPATAFLFVILAIVLARQIIATDHLPPYIRSDGVGYHLWTYTILSGNLDFCRFLHNGDVDVVNAVFRVDNSREVCQDKYPPGVALLQLPIMAPLVAFRKLGLPITPAEHIVSACCAALALAGAVLLVLATLRRLGVPSALADATIVLLTFGTGLFHYATFDGSYSHVYSALTFSALLYWGIRYRNDPYSTGAIVVFTLLALLLVLLKNTNVIAIGWLAAAWLWVEAPTPDASRDGRGRGRFAPLAAVAGGVGAGGLLQLLYNWFASGHLTLSSYGQEPFLWGRPMWPAVLVSYERGLFTYYPIVLVAVIVGLLSHASRRAAFLFTSCCASYAVLYGYWHSWTLGASFGHRGFVELVPAAMLLFGVGIRDFSRKWRFWILGASAVCAAATMKWMLAYWAYVLPFSGATASVYWRSLLWDLPVATGMLSFLVTAFVLMIAGGSQSVSPFQGTTDAAQDPSSAQRPRGRSLSLALIAGCAVGLACLAIFFRSTVVSGGAMLPGDLGDTRFNNALLEHWVQWPRGSWSWNSPPWFFPERRVLGYSDTLFLFLPFYWLSRTAGASPYYALACTTALLMLFGYASMSWLLRRVLGLPTWLSLFGAALFGFAGLRSLHYPHVQIFAALFAPLLLGAALRYLSQQAAGGYGFGSGLVVAVGVPLLLFTSFYMGWFLFFFLALGAIWLMLLKIARSGPAVLKQTFSRRLSWSLFPLGVTFLIALLPFLALYLPRYGEIGPRVWEAVAKMLPRPIDLINVSSRNLVWGSLITKVLPAGRDYGWELEYGMPPALFLLFCATTAALFWPRRPAWLANSETERNLDLLRALALAVLSTWVLLLNWHDYSLWQLVFKIVPGASALRAISRFQNVLQVAVVIVAMFGLWGLWRAARPRVSLSVLVIGLGFLLAYEQVEEPAVFDAQSETALLSRVDEPPPFCRQFLVLPDTVRVRGVRPFTPSIDAMMIALRFRLPTINGYSGDIPFAWDLVDPFSPGYVGAAADWIWKHQLAEGFCTIDLASGSWRRVLAADASALLGKNLIELTPRTLEEALSFWLNGFHGIEAGGRWTDGLGSVRFSSPVSATRLRIEGAWNVRGAPVLVVVNGRVKYSAVLPNGPFSFELPLPEPVSSIEVDSASFVPQKMGINDDPRRLGVVIKSMVLD